jgi:hypothetical protein
MKLALRPTTAVSPTRKRIALAIAALADAVQLGLFPVFAEGALSIPDDALDAVVAVMLVATLGWSWRLSMALAAEMVPGLALFPTWTAFVLMVRSEPPPPVAALPGGAGQTPQPPHDAMIALPPSIDCS